MYSYTDFHALYTLTLALYTLPQAQNTPKTPQIPAPHISLFPSNLFSPPPPSATGPCTIQVGSCIVQLQPPSLQTEKVRRRGFFLDRHFLSASGRLLPGNLLTTPSTHERAPSNGERAPREDGRAPGKEDERRAKSEAGRGRGAGERRGAEKESGERGAGSGERGPGSGSMS